MPLIVKEDPSEYPLCPDGLHSAVIVDAVDLGQQESPWGAKHKLSLVFETQLQDEEGNHYILAKRYTWSLHEKSSLRKDLERLLGKKFTFEELLAGVDLEVLIGMSCQILVVHNDSQENSRTFANIESILPYKTSSGQVAKNAIKSSGNYQRVIERADYQTPKEFALNRV